MAECYNFACPYCSDYQCKRTATCDNRLDGEYVKVKHGRWKAWDLTWGRSIYVCTSCGDAMEVPTEGGKPIYDYCPNCGARMDLDEVEECLKHID